ncbi:MAG: YraN family protein [Alphaproteobacteria bacterium]|nr:YraN family protein [Alphaproteobacteria bacterium]
MPSARRRAAYRAGLDAEERVAEHLEAAGWRIIARRWRGGRGELDLIARDGSRLRFVEVKLRQPGDPVGLECVSGHKLRRLRSAAEAFLMGYDGPLREACLMVALVEPGPDGVAIHLLDDPD